MKVVVDANVVLDVLLEREPHVGPAATLMSKIERGAVRGFLCDTTILTLQAVAERLIGAERARQELRKLLLLFDVASVNRVVLESALVSKSLAFEEAVVYEAARHLAAEALVTRGFEGFRGAELPICTPAKFLKMIGSRGRSHAEAWG